MLNLRLHIIFGIKKWITSKKKNFAKSPRVKTAIRWRSFPRNKNYPPCYRVQLWVNFISSSTQVTLTRDSKLSGESLGFKFINFILKSLTNRIFDLRRRAEFVIEIKTAGIIANINKIKNHTKPPKWTKQ